MRQTLPKAGRGWDALKAEMTSFASEDVDWRHGRHAFHVWFGGEDIFDIQRKAYTMFMQENGGGAGKTFMSLKRMEDAVIGYAAELLHGPDAVGHITSGGSESIFVAMKAARDWAKSAIGVKGTPEVVIPQSGHPTFNRAAEYLGLKIVRTPLGKDYRGSVAAMRDAITPNTIALVGSAVCFPFGLFDPIGELGELATKRGLWLHVDACVAGFTAPFARELGYPVPDFDFSVPGVISISADLHKYGFCAKGTSTVLYRNKEFERYQPFEFNDWPLGRFANPNVASTRPGGSISGAWAVMNYLGHDGYLELNRTLMGIRDNYVEHIEAINGLKMVGTPGSLIIAFCASAPAELDMAIVGQEMLERGWFLGPILRPPGLMMGLSSPHGPVLPEFARDLEASVRSVLSGESKVRSSRQLY
jgi:glutamate/tyrosine decarboxylase-like PLP-dependent enzyme